MSSSGGKGGEKGSRLVGGEGGWRRSGRVREGGGLEERVGRRWIWTGRRREEMMGNVWVG